MESKECVHCKQEKRLAIGRLTRQFIDKDFYSNKEMVLSTDDLGPICLVHFAGYVTDNGFRYRLEPLQ